METENTKNTILVVDDQAANLKVVASLFSSTYNILLANSGERAFNILSNSNPDLILLDVMMPIMNGYEVCKILKSDARYSDIPIIFLTARAEINDVVQGFSLGAVDYITKPFNHTEMDVRIKTHISLYHSKNEIKLMNNKLIISDTELRETNKILKEHKAQLEDYSLRLEYMVEERTKELADALKELEKANKFKTEIIANMNHEIRTPLNFIKGAVALLNMDLKDTTVNPDIFDTLDSLNEGTNRLVRTLEIFADLSALKSGNYKPNFTTFCLNNLLCHFDLLYSKRIKESDKAITLTTENVIVNAKIQADEQNVTKIIDFILDNAVKYTNEGSIILNLSENTAEYILKIEDTGIGIEEAFLDKIFEPFAQEDMTATRNYEGIGLSLALAKEYANANSISIIVQSEKGRGSCFYLVFKKC